MMSPGLRSLNDKQLQNLYKELQKLKLPVPSPGFYTPGINMKISGLQQAHCALIMEVESVLKMNARHFRF